MARRREPDREGLQPPTVFEAACVVFLCILLAMACCGLAHGAGWIKFGDHVEEIE